jgi:hypothetical protein
MCLSVIIYCKEELSNEQIKNILNSLLLKMMAKELKIKLLDESLK